MATPEECRRHAESLEAFIKEGKSKFRGEVKTFETDGVTFKVFIENGVIIQAFVYPFDLNADSSPLIKKLNESGRFNDVVRIHHYILKHRLPDWQKYFGNYLKIEKEDPTGVFVLIDVDVEGFRKRGMP